MNPSVITTLNDPRLIAIREKHIERLTRLYDGEELDTPFVYGGYAAKAEADPFAEPEKWADEALTDLAEHAELAADEKVFRPLTAYHWFYGVHFTDRVFGAPVRSNNGQWWSDGVSNEIGELPVPDLETNETWKMIQRHTLALVNAGVKLPFYTPQVLGEPWNQLFNLYHDEALYGFYDDPDGMKRDLGVMTDTLVQMHEWFLKTIPADQFQPILPEARFQPRGCGQMCGCATHLISHDIYEEFIREHDERIAALYPRGVMLHLCGGHTQHLPSWREMPGIRAFQLNDRAMDDLEAFYKQTRKDQFIHHWPTKEITITRGLELTEGGKRSAITTWELELRAKRPLDLEEAIKLGY